MKIWTVVAVLLLLLAAGCAPLPAATTPSAEAVPAAAITVEGAFARPSPSEGGAGGVFMTIANNGDAADRLVGAGSPAAKMVEIHETIDDNGVMKMRAVAGGFEIPAGGKLELKPGGKHVMLMGLTTPLMEGGEVEVTLTFENAGPVTVKAPVKIQ
jgi:periplasmic copper chaperone A